MRVIAVILICFSVASLARAETVKSPSVSVFDNIVYYSPPETNLHLNIFVRETEGEELAPVLLYFHGGAWSRGKPPQTWSAFKRYIAAGFSVVTVQYRLSNVAPAPAAVFDACKAIEWTAKHSHKFEFDPKKIVLVGTSAGGHIALMAGFSAGFLIDDDVCDTDAKVAAILNYYGPANLADWFLANGKRPRSVLRWIGDKFSKAEVLEKMTPLNRIRPDSPPVFIVHGDKDPVVPFAQSIALKSRLDASGVVNRLVSVPEGTHGGFAKSTQAEIEISSLAFLKDIGVIP